MITVMSFGYGHAAAPDLDIEIDARAYRNPHRDPAMRYLTGHDAAVRAHVLATSGVTDAIADAIERTRQLLTEQPERDVRVGVGCVGGRHRSVAMAAAIAAELADQVPVSLEHRDAHQPVIQSALGDRRTESTSEPAEQEDR